jgi:hypothetical protein
VQDLRDDTTVLDPDHSQPVLLLLPSTQSIPFFLEDELEEIIFVAHEIVMYLCNEWRGSDSKTTALHQLRYVCTTFIRNLEEQHFSGKTPISWTKTRVIFEVVIAAPEMQDSLLFAIAIACLEGRMAPMADQHLRDSRLR